MLGLGKVFEKMDPEVLKNGFFRKAAGRRRIPRDENLAPPARRQESGGAVYYRSEIILPTLFRIPGMEGHPDAQLSEGSPVLDSQTLLNVHGALQRGRLLKHREDSVSGVLDDTAAILIEVLPEDGIVSGKGFAHSLPVGLPLGSGAFDVGEEKYRHVL